MNNSRVMRNSFSTTVLALLCCVGASAVSAEDIVPAKVQSDAQISVWVNNASLDVFVSQLAVITGRDASIDGELQGQVSGRFNGTMIDTLNTVGERFPILFDLDDSILGVVAETKRTNATIALGEVALDEQVKGSLLSGMLPGNSVDIREDEVVVSGHPSFVNRIAKVVTLAVARSEPIAISAGDDKVQTLEPVFDVAAQEILDEAALEILAVEPSVTASTSQSSSGEIRWVTDIPGYETF